MTEQELKLAYGSMSMSEERAAAIEDRLIRLFDRTEQPASIPHTEQQVQEYHPVKKKRSPAVTAITAVCAAAAAVLVIFGGRYLFGRINDIPVTPNSPATEEATAETAEAGTSEAGTLEEPTYDSLFNSESDIPPYGNIGYYDSKQLTLTTEISGSALDKSWLDGALNPTGDYGIAQMTITYVEEWNTQVYYTAQIDKWFMEIPAASESVNFEQYGTFTVQQPGRPPLCVGDEILGVVTTESGDKTVLLEPTELLFEIFYKDGIAYAGQRYCTAPCFTEGLTNYQGPQIIARTTSTAGNPVRYYGIYRADELAENTANVLQKAQEENGIWNKPLNCGNGEELNLARPSAPVSFEDVFGYYWLEIQDNAAKQMICFGSDIDYFGTVHGDPEYSDPYCRSFYEDDYGWYIFSFNPRGGDSIFFIPITSPHTMYRYDFGADNEHTYGSYNAKYIRQGKAEWCLDVQPGGQFYSEIYNSATRKPVEHYVGKISWLGIQSLCQQYGDYWAEEFNKWYNIGGSMEIYGETWHRIPLLAGGGEEFWGAGDVYLIDHTEDRIVAAFRFASEEWYSYRQEHLSEADSGGIDMSGFNGGNAAAYFILTAEYSDGVWQESWERLTHIDGMMLEGYITPNEYQHFQSDERYAYGNNIFTVTLFDWGSSELFSYNRLIDEYTRLNWFRRSLYLQHGADLYAVGSTGEGFVYASRYNGSELAAGSLCLGTSFENMEIRISADEMYLIVSRDLEDGTRRTDVLDRITLEEVDYGTAEEMAHYLG